MVAMLAVLMVDKLVDELAVLTVVNLVVYSVAMLVALMVDQMVDQLAV